MMLPSDFGVFDSEYFYLLEQIWMLARPAHEPYSTFTTWRKNEIHIVLDRLSFDCKRAVDRLRFGNSSHLALHATQRNKLGVNPD